MLVKEAQTLKRADPEALADASLRLDLTEGALGCASRPERGKPREMAPQLPGLRQATALWAPDVVVVVLWGVGGRRVGAAVRGGCCCCSCFHFRYSRDRPVLSGLRSTPHRRTAPPPESTSRPLDTGWPGRTRDPRTGHRDIGVPPPRPHPPALAKAAAPKCPCRCRSLAGLAGPRVRTGQCRSRP